VCIIIVESDCAAGSSGRISGGRQKKGKALLSRHAPSLARVNTRILLFRYLNFCGTHYQAFDTLSLSNRTMWAMLGQKRDSPEDWKIQIWERNAFNKLYPYSRQSADCNPEQYVEVRSRRNYFSCPFNNTSS
jgi:hypothetical protein